MNLLISGPCGVGKSTVARILAQRTEKDYLDFDSLGITDMEKIQPRISSFSPSGLNLIECLPPILNEISGEFILDIGGDNIFRPRVDNDKRLKHVLWLKEKYSIQIVILTATRNILCQRFNASRNQILSNFDILWGDWQIIGKPYWQKCADLIIDTSFHTPYETSYRIEEIQKN